MHMSSSIIPKVEIDCGCSTRPFGHSRPPRSIIDNSRNSCILIASSLDAPRVNSLNYRKDSSWKRKEVMR